MSAIQRTQKRRVVVEPFPASLLIADELPCALYHKTDQGRFERYIQSERPAGRKPDRVYISTENRPIVDRYLANQADHYIQNSDAPLAKKATISTPPPLRFLSASLRIQPSRRRSAAQRIWPKALWT